MKRILTYLLFLSACTSVAPTPIAPSSSALRPAADEAPGNQVLVEPGKTYLFAVPPGVSETWLFHQSTATGCAVVKDNLRVNHEHLRLVAPTVLQYEADQACGCDQLDGLGADKRQLFGVTARYATGDCPAPKMPEPGGTCPAGFLMTGEGCKLVQVEEPPFIDACGPGRAAFLNPGKPGTHCEPTTCAAPGFARDAYGHCINGHGP